MVARALRRAFQTTYNVVHFYSVKEAVEWLRSHTPDILVTDRQVGWENGWDLRLKVGASVRVVLMTGAEPQGNVLPFFHKGVDNLQKLRDMVEGKEV